MLRCKILGYIVACSAVHKDIRLNLPSWGVHGNLKKLKTEPDFQFFISAFSRWDLQASRSFFFLI